MVSKTGFIVLPFDILDGRNYSGDHGIDDDVHGLSHMVTRNLRFGKISIQIHSHYRAYMYVKRLVN